MTGGCGPTSAPIPPAPRALPSAIATAVAPTTPDDASPPPSPAGAMAPTGAMASARAAHTASALPDGRVLVVGGFSRDERSAAGAEIYDPATGAFAAAAEMVTRRHSHSATVLPDGRVLVAGGYDAAGDPTSAAELYDPARARFEPTGAMGGARANHAAALLADGRVLVVGGVAPGWLFLASAEIYDPGTGRFTAAGGMRTAREGHAVARLDDGRVLVVGGHRGRGAAVEILRDAELFDPATGEFAPAGDMTLPRHKHDAVRLPDGRVLITGGADARDSGGVYDGAEVYDPSAGAFEAIEPLQRPRYKHAGTSIVLPSGLVLIAGGAARAERFDPGTGRFTLVDGAADLRGQFSAAAALPGGGVLVTGGYGAGGGPGAGAWVYRP